MEEIYKLLTKEDCIQIIQTALDDTNIKFISYTINPLSDVIEGFMGQHFRLEIKYESESVSIKKFFMKILNGTSNVIFELCMSVNAYEREEFIYNTYLQELKKLRIELNCVPRCYLCKPYLIVLEDLSEKGYTAARSSELNIDTCKQALKAVAKLHCSSILSETYKNEDQKETFSWISKYPNVLYHPLICKEDNLAKVWLSKSVEGLYKIIQVIPENDVKKEEFVKKLSEFHNRFYELNEQFKDSLCTVLHGDLWHNNFLFKYHNGKPCESVLLDFQLIRYGPPFMDVLNFMFSNTRKTFRDSNFEELINYYYECVKNYLSRHNYGDIPSKSKILLKSNDLKLFVKLLCVCDRCITLMPNDSITTIENDEDLRNYLVGNRTTHIVNSYMADEHFREIIKEDILELRDLLFAKS